MAVPFDHIASPYDSLFAQSAIGQLQRRHVWDYLEKIIPQLGGLEMLELDYGTGDDALMFTEKGFNLVATDLSEEMQKITQQKTHQMSLQHKVASQYIDLDSLNESNFNKKFDLVLSNFAGLNCINPDSLKKLLEKLPSILSPKGRFIAVVMPKFCIWESTFYFFRLQFGKILKRWTSTQSISSLYGFPTKLWYYHPAEIKQWAKSNFSTIKTKPIGLVLPPASLENLFSHKKQLLFFLNRFEKKLNHISFSAGMADHFIIDLQLR